MTYRWVQGSEAARLLNPLLRERGWAELPELDNPPLARSYIAEEDGRVQGFSVIQLFPVVGPLWSEGASVPRMIQATREALGNARGWIVLAENPRMESVCRTAGMEKVAFPVYITGGE